MHPTDEELDYLYNNCIAFLLLSNNEGFGIPVLEAAARSKKVIVSDVPALKEIAPKHSLILNMKKGRTFKANNRIYKFSKKTI